MLILFYLHMLLSIEPLLNRGEPAGAADRLQRRGASHLQGAGDATTDETSTKYVDFPSGKLTKLWKITINSDISHERWWIFP